MKNRNGMPVVVTGRLATRAGIGRGRSRAWRGDRNGAAAGAASQSLTVLAAGSGILLAAALLAGCGEAARPAAARSPTTTSSAAIHATHPGPSAPSPPAGVAGLRLVGANGRTAWQLTATGLSVSRDAGQHWSTAALPAGVAPSSITTITAAGGRGLWLAAWRHPAIDLYHQDGGLAGWWHRTLVPRLPSSLAFLDGQPPGVSITLGPANLVTMVADWGITSTQHYSTLFVSSDDGIIFAQHPTNIGLFVSSDIFLSPRQGIIVAGPLMNDLYRTADGGASWVPLTIPRLPSGPAASRQLRHARRRRNTAPASGYRHQHRRRTGHLDLPQHRRWSSLHRPERPAAATPSLTQRR